MKIMKSSEGVVTSNNSVTDVTGGEGGEGVGGGQRGNVSHDYDEGDECSQAHKDMGGSSIVGSSSNSNNDSSSSSHNTHRSSDDILNDRAAVSGASRMNKTKAPHSIATESQDYSVPHIGSFRRHCNVCKQPYPALHSFYHQVRHIPFLLCPVLPYHALSCCFVLYYAVLYCLALLSISFMYYSSMNQRSTTSSHLCTHVFYPPSKNSVLHSL
jgi:hypothetical protein